MGISVSFILFFLKGGYEQYNKNIEVHELSLQRTDLCAVVQHKLPRWAGQHHVEYTVAFVLLRCQLKINVCFLPFQAFREEIAPINLKVKTVNDLSSQLSPLDLYPSLKMSRQLDDLNMRWKLLQVFF